MQNIEQHKLIITTEIRSNVIIKLAFPVPSMSFVVNSNFSKPGMEI